MEQLIGNLIGEAAHRFLGVDPGTGKIIGAIAGNVIFNLGGKDNSLGNIGKIILDNIISGKWRRDVGFWSRFSKTKYRWIRTSSRSRCQLQVHRSVPVRCKTSTDCEISACRRNVYLKTPSFLLMILACSSVVGLQSESNGFAREWVFECESKKLNFRKSSASRNSSTKAIRAST